MKRIILGSASPRRRELLEQIGMEFEVVVSDGEETYRSKVPEEIVKELALRKAEQVASKLAASGKAAGQSAAGSTDAPLRNLVIIGADTIVVKDGEILGKPADEEHAFRMLKGLQGRVHQVYTGVALLDYSEAGEKRVVNHAEETKVFVHSMDEEEIRRYISTGEPMDKAGAYGIQGRFAAYIDRIEGDYYNVVGLPAAYLYAQLKELQCVSGCNQSV